MPNLFEQYGYKIYFWSNELGEPIHVHISKGTPQENATKVWITKSGGCIVANNNSKIPKNDLNSIIKTINLNFLYIIAKWKEVQGTEDVKFYC